MQKIILTITLLFFLTNNTFTQPIERDQVEEKHKWNLTDIYPSVEAWQTDVDLMNAKVEMLSDFKGKLGESADVLFNALNTGDAIVKTLAQAMVYANNLSNENLNIAANQALVQQVRTIWTKFGEVTAYFEPEVLEIPKEKIQQFIAVDCSFIEFLRNERPYPFLLLLRTFTIECNR
jgi:oligoendopeptidase F